MGLCALSAPRHTPQTRKQFQAAWARVTTSLPPPPPPPPALTRTSYFLPPSGSSPPSGKHEWLPTLGALPASSCLLPGYRPRWGGSRAQHRDRCPGRARRVVPWGSGPPFSPAAPGLQDSYLSGGPAPTPAPTGVLGNRHRYALHREPPPSAPAEPRSGRGHMEEGSQPPPLGSTFSPLLLLLLPGKLFPMFPTPSHSSFSGHPGQSEPVRTARVAGGRRRRRRRRWRWRSGR